MRALLAGLTLLLVTAAPAAAATDPLALHGQCLVVREADGPVRLQATKMGHYLLLQRDGRFVTGAAPAAEPGPDGDLRFSAAEGDAVRVVRIDGRPLGTFTPKKAEGCKSFPELEVNVSGTPYQGPTSFGETKGLIETHLHGMAFEFIGGSIHCGRPWHPYGVTKALVDCPDHATGTPPSEAVLSGNPSHTPDGWPTFKGWPTFRSYTHEQAYYKWLERAWRGGLRLYTNLLVDNQSLCEIYPLKRNRCDEMENIRIQRKRLDELVDYVDAQSGGPGKGWLRIVRNPFEARRVINEGKLALVVGIETSLLFNCGEVNDRPSPGCDRASIDRQLEEVHAMGVRQMQLINKSDNAFSGVAGDAGSTGIITNAGNKRSTGHFWSMQTCTGPDPEHEHDREQVTAGGAVDRDELAGAILSAFAPQDAAPVYPSGPHCNTRGLTELGDYLIRRMIDKKMLLDPDHMSVRGRAAALSLIEGKGYGGIMSSHSWSTPEAYRRIVAMGGLVTPAPKTSEGFIEEWTTLRKAANPKFLFGTGFSTDINGFASQGGPRKGMDVKYPFRSLDGSTSIDRQVSGTRTFDINKDGTAHFGMYPDRIQDIADLGGPVVAQDLLNGSEAYLQMWERAAGVPDPECRAAQRRFTRNGFGEIRLGQDPEGLLKSAGQPQRREGRTFSWCAEGTKGGEVDAVLTTAGKVELVASTARLHRFRGVGAGSAAAKAGTRRAGAGLRTREAGRGRVAIFGIKRGRVAFTAVTTRRVAADRARLTAALKAAGLR